MPIEKEIDNGVSCKHWLLRCWRLTVHLGVLFFLAVMTIWLHQVVVVPIATSVIPFLTWWSSAALTWPFQWRGTSIGVCCTWGTAPSLTWIWAGFVNITGNRVEQLNVVSRNWSRRYCLSLGIFLGVARCGSVNGCCGNCGWVIDVDGGSGVTWRFNLDGSGGCNQCVIGMSWVGDVHGVWKLRW